MHYCHIEESMLTVVGNTVVTHVCFLTVRCYCFSSFWMSALTTEFPACFQFSSRSWTRTL